MADQSYCPTCQVTTPWRWDITHCETCKTKLLDVEAIDEADVDEDDDDGGCENCGALNRGYGAYDGLCAECLEGMEEAEADERGHVRRDDGR